MMKTLFAAAALALVAGTAGASTLLNEFQPNPDGADPSTQMIELIGTPGAAFNGYLFSLEADNANSATVDRKSALTGTFGANGLLTFAIADLENPSFTVVLTDSTATANLGDELFHDQSALGFVYDAISIIDAATDTGIAGLLGGTDFAFTGTEPEWMFRDSVTGKWIAVNDNVAGTGIFDETGTELDAAGFNQPLTGTTFGAANPTMATPAVPLPASLPRVLAAFGGLAALRRRK
jgi:hypothetical protein